jgi:hypothetical protein
VKHRLLTGAAFCERGGDAKIEDTGLYELTVQGKVGRTGHYLFDLLCSETSELTFVDILQEFSTRDTLSCTESID